MFTSALVETVELWTYSQMKYSYGHLDLEFATWC